MFKIIAKFALAAGLIYWLYQKGSIDFSLVAKSFEYKLNWVICISIIVFQALCTIVRWKLLLELKHGSKLPMIPMIKLTWIGLFFSSILPGAVTGDLIKVVYARDLSPKINKTFLVTSALMDRVMGLMGLLFVLGTFSLYNYSELKAISPELTKLVHVNFLVFAGMLVAMLSILLPGKIQEIIKSISLKVPIIGKNIAKTFEQIWIIGAHKKTVLKCFALSILTQFCAVIAFYTISSPFYENPLPLNFAFSFLPLGMMALAIPISPSGAGVGHAIFNWLFAFFSISGGAGLFNLYFLAYFSVNVLGFIPYVLSGKKPNFKNLEKELN